MTSERSRALGFHPRPASPTNLRFKRLITTLVLASLMPLGVACSGSNDSPIASDDSTTTSHSSQPLSAHFEIDRDEVRTGEDFFATIVLVNDTGSPLESYACSPSLYQAELAGPNHIPDGGSLDCIGAHIVPVGETRISVKVSTRAQFCSDPPSTRFDPCLPGDRHPPYPAGPYELIASSQDTRLPIPPPVPIELIE